MAYSLDRMIMHVIFSSECALKFKVFGGEGAALARLEATRCSMGLSDKLNK